MSDIRIKMINNKIMTIICRLPVIRYRKKIDIELKYKAQCDLIRF